MASAELVAACSALGYYDKATDKYYADSNTLETVKDLIRYLRRDDASHEARRQLGATNVLQTDLLPLLKSYWEELDLLDVLLRLLVNLTTPALMLWQEKVPTESKERNYYLQIEDHLKSYKDAFADETFWAVLTTRLSKILEIDYSERGDTNSLVIERILILIRNILHVAPDPLTEKRADNDASLHDQVLFALQQSGMLDLIIYMAGSTREKAYYMHILEILSFLLREQKASELADAALQRSEMEKIRDEAELLAIRHRETTQRTQNIKKYNGARHSTFGGTYVCQSMKGISDNDLIYHKPLNAIEELKFDTNKQLVKKPKNRRAVQSSSYERRSTFTMRLFLKKFCVEFLNGAYNTLMYYVKDTLVRAKSQAHDETFYLWAIRFFMEFNRYYKFEMKLVSETMSIQAFRYVQKTMETYFDMMASDKKHFLVWSYRLHVALLAYRELLLTLNIMDRSEDEGVRKSTKTIKNNIFYILEYREFIITLLIAYNELQMSNAYLKDLLETQHIFLKMLETFCGRNGSVLVVQKKKKGGKHKKKQATRREENDKSTTPALDLNLESRWDEAAPQLSIVLEGNLEIRGDAVPFDAASDVPIDEQKSEAMKNVQRKLRNGEFENAISLLRAARDVWPENDCFGSNNMATEEEFLALRDIFFADLGENEVRKAVEVTIDEVEDDEEEDPDLYGDCSESDFKFEDFVSRLANPRVVRACGLALNDFQANSVNTNHCIIKLLHRIAFDSKLPAMVFQVSMFQTFQHIFANKELPQYRELVKFATYIIRQFVKVAETNKKVYMEALFWKRSNEAYEIEHGYQGESKNLSNRAWSEEQEEELRRLFIEHQENQLKEDVIDWLLKNLIDYTRTRRVVIKKLKNMNLLLNYKPPNPNHQWSDEQEIQLRELYDEFKDAPDPVSCIMLRVDGNRSKAKVVQKMLDLGIIQDRAQVRKKGAKKSKSGLASFSDEENDNLGDFSDDEDDDRNIPSTSTSNRTANKPKLDRKASRPVPYNSLAKYLNIITNAGLNEALEWVRESFSDAIEDYESGDNAEGIPMVPIMDYAVDAMDNLEFQLTLKALGICPPFDEQETYWRIPGDFALEDLKSNIDIIEKALAGTLAVEEDKDPDELEEVVSVEASSNIASSLENSEHSRDVDADGSSEHNLPSTLHDSNADNTETHKDLASQVKTPVLKKKIRAIIDSDEEETVNSNDSGIKEKTLPTRSLNSGSEGEKEQKETVNSNYNGVKKKTLSSRSKYLILNSDPESEKEEEETVNSNDNKIKENTTFNRKNRFLDSDSESEEENSKRRLELDSDSDKPKPKRSRQIISDDED